MKNKPVRLHELADQLEDWAEERCKQGQLHYGENDKKRYGLLDGMEELLDFDNIVFNRNVRRWLHDILSKYPDREDLALAVQLIQESDEWERLKELSYEMKQLLMKVDKMLPDELATDENGGNRQYVGRYTKREFLRAEPDTREFLRAKYQ